MTNLAHESVKPLLYGYRIETGVDAATDLGEVGRIGEHWCSFVNMNESPRKLKVTGTISKRDGIRYHRATEDGSLQEHLTWTEPVTLPARPGAKWLRQPKQSPIRLRHMLGVTHLDKSSASLVVKFKSRRADTGPWEAAGGTVLQLPIGNGGPHG